MFIGHFGLAFSAKKAAPARHAPAAAWMAEGKSRNWQYGRR